MWEFFRLTTPEATTALGEPQKQMLDKLVKLDELTLLINQTDKLYKLIKENFFLQLIQLDKPICFVAFLYDRCENNMLCFQRVGHKVAIATLTGPIDVYKTLIAGGEHATDLNETENHAENHATEKGNHAENTAEIQENNNNEIEFNPSVSLRAPQLIVVYADQGMFGSDQHQKGILAFLDTIPEPRLFFQ